ncbi:hypothetical protein [Thalassotalea marina]|uniref:Uncharacterized protein n=1 Tax=Thalassotalea marina TaxID=1673741 RepID=A0A919EHL7_9GAMM|nr:hypothetical protein [Thalassotalea marina]GHF79287.1 hypothetical protein GCM10017161_03070 [Thalassotalea marina]
MNSPIKKEEKSTKEASHFTGYHFQFDVNGHHFEIKASANSGKESVWLDGKLVSEHHTIRRRSCHKIKVDNKLYEIEFYVAKLLTGEVHCSLIEDGTHVATKKQALSENKIVTIAFTVAGGIVGFAVGFTVVTYFAGKLTGVDIL